MNRLYGVALFVALLVGLTLALGPSGAREDKPPTIKQIMGKAHKGDDSLIEKLGKELKDDKPEWEIIQKQSKELLELGTALGKNTPPKGDKESWEKLTKKYVEIATILEGAAEKKELKKAQSAQAGIKTMCAMCHPLHKPK
jgi:hypothetical protein